jgi:solute carrier family 25 protein 42
MADGPSASAAPRRSRPQKYAFGLSDATVTSISGSVSGFAATFAKQPIQRIKWLRQIESGTAVPYNELVVRTLQKDGVLGLFRGSVAGIMRNVPHSALVYTIYPNMEAIVLRVQQQQTRDGSSGGGGGSSGHDGSSRSASDSTKKVSFSTRFWAGYATLFFATLITHPLDTLRVRISVTHGEVSTFATTRSILESGGWRALYQGFGATLVGAGPRGAVGFGVFETLKDLSSRHTELQRFSPTTQKLLFGYLAGFCAETVIYPLDTVRRRQQALGSSSPLGQRHLVSALLHIARTEGVPGMFKGLSLNLIKNPIATAVSFTVNDLIKDMLVAKQPPSR